MPKQPAKPLTILLIQQGLYFSLTGLWPFVHLQSFLIVTGPKIDIWLLKTVAALILVIGLTLLVAGWRREYSGAIALLGMGSALGLMAVDIYYATHDIISDVYLLDAVAEAVIISCWVFILIRFRTVL